MNMSRHWVKQRDDHKGKVDRVCFHSNLPFVMSLLCFGIKTLLFWTQVRKQND